MQAVRTSRPKHRHHLKSNGDADMDSQEPEVTPRQRPVHVCFVFTIFKNITQPGAPDFSLLDTSTLLRYKRFFRVRCRSNNKSDLVPAVVNHFHNTLQVDESVIDKFVQYG